MPRTSHTASSTTTGAADGGLAPGPVADTARVLQTLPFDPCRSRCARSSHKRASTLQEAAAAYAEVAKMPSIIDRESGLLEHAVRAGALDAVARAQDLRRVLDSGRRYDAAVLALRVVRAKWIRRARL
jgi:hypothetical protein